MWSFSGWYNEWVDFLQIGKCTWSFCASGLVRSSMDLLSCKYFGYGQVCSCLKVCGSSVGQDMWSFAEWYYYWVCGFIHMRNSNSKLYAVQMDLFVVPWTCFLTKSWVIFKWVVFWKFAALGDNLYAICYITWYSICTFKLMLYKLCTCS